MDKASQERARSILEGESKSFRARAEYSNVPRTTLQHRARGRRSKKEKDEVLELGLQIGWWSEERIALVARMI
jgi:hypothetical protein